MTKYSIKTSPKKAFKLISMIKAIKYGTKFKTDVSPKTKLQKDLLDDLMNGFFRAVKSIKENLE